MKKSLFFLLILILSLSACAPAVTQPAAATNPPESTAISTPDLQVEDVPASSAEGGSVTRALTSEPTSLDPQGPAISGQSVILPYLFDTLVYRDADNTYQPYLAESWDIAPDGLSVTFHLRQGVHFTDGTPLDAEAVVYTFERFKQVGAKSPIAGGIMEMDTIKALDAQTVKFGFTKPSSTFFGTVSMPYAGILSPTAVKAEGDAFGQKPVGSGPFMLSDWKPGVSIDLTRNPDYQWAPAGVKNQGPAHIEKAIFKIIPDPTSQLAAFQTGDVDILYLNQAAQVAKLEQEPDVQRFDSVMNSLVYLGFNCKKTPLDDVKVRQALSHAVDKEQLVKTILPGLADAAFAPLSPTLPGFDASLKSYEMGYDLEQARTDLKDAGFAQSSDGSWSKGGVTLALTLVTSTRPPNGDIATLLQSQFKALGVQVEIQQLESQAAMDAMVKGNYDIALWRYDWNDADVLNIYLASDRIGRTNRQFYSNPQVDDLLSKAASSMDAAARSAMYVEAQKMILTDAPWLPLYVPKDVIFIGKAVQNVAIGSMGRVLLNDVTVK